MSEVKEVIVPDSGNNCANMLGILAPMLQSRGIDPNILCAMKNNNCDGSWFMWVIFLFFLMGNRNGYWGNDTGLNLINSNEGKELLMQAISGNQNAIQQLSSNLNCNTNAIQNAINSLATQIQNVGSNIGMTSQQIINSIQNGNNQIATQLSNCCCNLNNNITKMGYDNQINNLQQTSDLTREITSVGNRLERGFCDTAYATREQTCAIQNTLRDNTNLILEGQRNSEIRELQSKINALMEKNSQQAVVINNGQQSAMFAQMLQQAVTPINAALTGLTQEVSNIQSKMPATYPVQYQPFVAVPNAVAYQYGVGSNNGGFFS